MIKVTSYFEIDGRAEMAYDLDTNEPCEAYMKVSTEHTELDDGAHDTVRDLHRRMVASQLEIPVEYLNPIDEHTYLANVDDEYREADEH